MAVRRPRSLRLAAQVAATIRRPISLEIGIVVPLQIAEAGPLLSLLTLPPRTKAAVQSAALEPPRVMGQEETHVVVEDTRRLTDARTGGTLRPTQDRPRLSPRRPRRPPMPRQPLIETTAAAIRVRCAVKSL